MLSMWIKTTVVMLTCFLAGYIFGRKVGKSEGFELGLSYSPLDLRRKSLEEGTCPICGGKASNNQLSPLGTESAGEAESQLNLSERVTNDDENRENAWLG